MKTTFESFIEANNALTKCYHATPVDKWRQLSASEQSSLCRAERETVSGFLTTNQVGFANLIKERLELTGK